MAGKFLDIMNQNNRRYCLALDLKDDPKLIDEYIRHHQNVWPEIEDSISKSGIISMEIFHTGNRLFMIIVVDEHFSFEQKSIQDAANPKVQEWEILMWKFQQALPHASPGEKWRLMDKIYAYPES